MENVVRNLGDSPLQPEANYITCLNPAPQYKAPTRNFQMNKVEEPVTRTTNCKVTEAVPVASSPDVDESSWVSKSRDWGEEVERADAENDFNSSPQHQVAAESAKLNDIKRKCNLRSPQNVYNDGMKYSGIGRGKYKSKSSQLQGTDFEQRMSDSPLLCNNTEMNSDLIPMHQTAMVENSSLRNSPDDICGVDIPKDRVRKNPLLQNAGEGDVLPVQAQLNGAYCLQGDMRVRNVQIQNVDHFGDYNYKRLSNGMDTFNPGYRHKNFRVNRVPNNSSNPLQYNKGFDNRNFGHRYQAPMPSNIKTYRPGKPHENQYRHHDNRRHPQQPPSRPPFPMPLDKIVYAKHREFSVYDMNRKFPPQNFNIQNEINRQISGSLPYVPQTNVAAFGTKHNASRIVNCDKVLCNKSDPPSNAKTWPIGDACTDSNTSTVSCHNRTVVTPQKSMPSRHCATCTSHPHEKHCPSSKEEVIHGQKKDFSGTCENFDPDNSQTRTTVVDKIDNIVKQNNNPDYNRIIPNDSYSALLNSERLPINDHTNSNYEFPLPNDVDIKNHPLEKTRSSDGKDPYLREKLGFPPAHLRKDFPHNEKTDASPKVHPGNVPSPKQSSGDYCNADGTQNNLMFLGDSNYLTSSVPHSSYADAIRMSPNTIGKITSCQMSNCVEMTVPKSNEHQENAHEKLHPKMEAEHPSSEWIMSRLSQVDLSAGNLVNVNGVTHQVASNSHPGVNPRPIAVSLEKPSFYNSKMGITTGVHVQPPPNISSPERRMLECQYVEEQLSTDLGYKKAGEKLSFLSDLTSTLTSTGEHSSPYIPVSIRTDSTFSDTSSVCSSMSGTFKGEGYCQMTKATTPPVIIMNNCGSTEGMTEISFGIEMHEIMKLCGDSDLDSVGDSPMTLLSDSGFCSTKMPDVGPCDAEALDDEETLDSSTKVEDDDIGEFIVVGNKKFLWQDRVDASKCNMSQILDFLQGGIEEAAGIPGIFYSE